MLGRTHQVIGIASASFWYLSSTEPLYNPATLSAVVITASIGSLLPDLDKSTADIWKKIPYGKIFGKIVDPFIAHRSFSHSILGMAFFGWLIYIIY